MNTLRRQFDQLIRDGVAIPVFQAEEALRLDELVGREASRINAASFGAFFGSLQVILGRYIILSAARLFETASPRYPTQSIPAVIEFLRVHADRLPIEQRPDLIKSLARLGAPVEELQTKSDADLTRFVAEFFALHFSAVDLGEVNVARALAALKTVRDKVVAHSEAVRLQDLPRPTYAELDALVTLARRFLGVVASAYLSTAYDNDTGYSRVSSDARRAARSLERLLVRAGVLPTRDTGA